MESEIRPLVKRGLSIPSITVLDPDGNILEDDQRKLFRYNAQGGKGADVIFGVGTTGEFNRMTNHDRQRLTTLLADEVRKINQGLSRGMGNPVEGWVGVVSGPANVFPREWRRAWHACYTGDDHLMGIFKEIFNDFESAQSYTVAGTPVEKAIACFKTALMLDGVISCDAVAEGTHAFTEDERKRFAESYHRIKEKIVRMCPSHWISQDLGKKNPQ